MRRNKNFLEQPASSGIASDTDFDLLFARHSAPNRVAAHTIPIDRIRPNPFQPRQTFEDIEDLAKAIQAQGFTSRLRVRHDPAQTGFFQLVYGERRLRAAQVAGLTEVPCDIAEHSDDDLIEIGLAENIQRRDLKPLEEAQAFQTMIAQQGYTQQRLAERIGKDRSYVESRLALLRAPEDVQQMLAERPDAIRAAREIAKLPTPATRRPLIDGVLAGALTRDDVASLVRQTLERSLDEPIAQVAQPQLDAVGQDSLSDEPKRLQGADPTTSPRPSNAFDRALARDIPTLRAVVSRWRQAAPALTPAQREQILAFVDEHLTELERLAKALQD